MKHVLVLILLVCGILTLPSSAQSPLDNAFDPIVGHWHWTSTVRAPLVMNFRADGTVTFKGGHGVWTYVPGTTQERSYEIKWGGRNVYRRNCA
jgi:hypothetical protein